MSSAPSSTEDPPAHQWTKLKSFPPNTHCLLCYSDADDPVTLGDLYQDNEQTNIICHYFCLVRSLLCSVLTFHSRCIQCAIFIQHLYFFFFSLLQLLSSSLVQNGQDHEGILGFLAKDILKEIRRGSRLVRPFNLIV